MSDAAGFWPIRAMKTVVIIGFGDTGILTAIALGKNFDVVAISPKPCMVRVRGAITDRRPHASLCR